MLSINFADMLSINFAELRYAVVALPASAAEGSPRTASRLARLKCFNAYNYCAQFPRGEPWSCFAREGTTALFLSRGVSGCKFLKWSCRRQPAHRRTATPLSLHPKGGLRSIPTLYVALHHGLHGRFYASRRRSPPWVTVPCWRLLGPFLHYLFLCTASRSLIMDTEGPRDGALCADGRFAELWRA